MLTPIVGFIPIARPTFDVPLAEEMTTQAYQSLTSLQIDLLGDSQLVMDMAAVEAAAAQFVDSSPDLLILFQASFADSTMAMRLMETIATPLLLWAIPEERVGGRLRLNSFCGINLAGHGLTRAGYSYDYVYAAPDDADALRKIGAIAQAAAVRKRLQTTRIGRIGENPAGFDTCLVDHEGLKQQLGLDVVQIDLNHVF